MQIFSPVINLVCTRSTRGEHLRLQAWYQDHLQLLLSAPELQHASLWRCMQTLQGNAPEYACIYAFASHEDFLRYEHGPQKAQAGVLTNAAPGRDSLEIVQREQYARSMHQQWPKPSASGGNGFALAICLDAQGSQGDAQLQERRWWAERWHALQACAGLRSAQLYTQWAPLSSSSSAPASQPQDGLFVLLEFATGDAQEAWAAWQWALAQPAQYGQAPAALRTRWAATAREITRWLR